MQILILGATGFVGNAIFHALVEDYKIVVGSRTPIEGYSDWRKVDFNQAINLDELLLGIDLVINTIGIAEGDFQKIQTKVPLMIFQACKDKNIKIINISAIGAEKIKPATEFLRTKKIADDYILLETSGKVIYPGIILGEKAQSSQLFKEISELPFVPLISEKKIPFVHIRQIIETIKKTINNYQDTPSQQFVIAQSQTLGEVFSAFKGKPLRTFKVPMQLIILWFKFLPKFRLGVFDKNMFLLFNHINANDYKPLNEKTTEYLHKSNIKASNHLLNLLGLLSISFIWIWSGVISLYSWKESLSLMNAIGVSSRYAPVFIIAGSLLDIIFGVSVFFEKFKKLSFKLQILTIMVYTLILTFLADSFWLHPFAPLAKNIPLVALIYILYKWENQKKFIL